MLKAFQNSECSGSGITQISFDTNGFSLIATNTVGATASTNMFKLLGYDPSTDDFSILQKSTSPTYAFTVGYAGGYFVIGGQDSDDYFTHTFV